MSGLVNHAPSVAVAGTLWLAATPALAGQFAVIHNFVGQGDGQLQPGPLVQDKVGNLYGAATPLYAGGAIVFKLTQTSLRHWTETTLFNFASLGMPNSLNPDLSIDATGALFGTTYNGGTNGNGVVFRLTPPKTGLSWTYDTLFNFPNSAGDYAGIHPYGKLVVGAGGVIFGTTDAGGPHFQSYYCYCGVAYELSPPAGSGLWTETVLHGFRTPPDAAIPDGLSAGPNGILYGTSAQGGTGPCLDGSGVYVVGCGTVYRLKPGQNGLVEEVITSAETFPFDVLTTGPEGILYGVAGTHVFSLQPPKQAGDSWMDRVVYAFSDGISGTSPAGAVVFDRLGRLYGATSSVGLDGKPVLYRLSPPAKSFAPWTKETLFSFPHVAGFESQPTGALLFGAE